MLFFTFNTVHIVVFLSYYKADKNIYCFNKVNANSIGLIKVEGQDLKITTWSEATCQLKREKQKQKLCGSC